MPSTNHKVKSWSMFFEDIVSGERTSDIRDFRDRNYQVGDIVTLQEFDPVKFRYTGREVDVLITYIQRNKSNPCAISREALHNDYGVLSIKLVSVVRKPETEVPKYLTEAPGIRDQEQAVTGAIHQHITPTQITFNN